MRSAHHPDLRVTTGAGETGAARDSTATFYTITDARFAPATMAMLNSLWLVGNHEPAFILDVGLRPEQRSILERAGTVIPFDRNLATNPTLFKPFATLVGRPGVAVIIDSDQIVTRPLHDILVQAADGAICAYPDPEADRWFEGWSTVFGLTAPLRREGYVNAGFLAFSVERWPSLLDRWWDLCRKIWQAPTIYEVAEDGPTSQGDQDALNALLMSELPPGSTVRLDPDEAPAAAALVDGVDVVDVRKLECRYRGKDTAMLHCAGKVKPWIARDWPYVRRTAYVRLLRRLLAADDVPLRPATEDVPLWLRPGPAGAAAMLGLNTALSLAWRIGDLPPVRPLARRARRALS
jgi:hypothetical protein